jgi:murein DD-endopeptidase MepM/ murein hydrolase activator NlpD
MVDKTTCWGSRFFPEIQICFRSSGPVRLSPRLQAALLSTVLAGTAAFTYVGVSGLGYEHLAAKKEFAAARAQAVSSGLQKRIDGLEQQVALVTRDRDKARSEAASLADQTGSLRSRLSSIEASLQSQSQAQQALQQQQARNTALTAQLDKIASDRAAEHAQLAQYKGAEAQLAQYKASLEQTARELAQLGQVRSKITIKRGGVHLELGQIWQKLSQIQLPLPGSTVAMAGSPASVAAAGTKPPGGVSPGVGDLGPDAVAAFEQTLRSAGVDVPRILSQLGKGPAEGGPFVPPPKTEGAPADPASPEKLAAIRALANTLPIAAPLARYELGSRFGPRIDPFNHRPAFHTGIDMDAPYASPVYATAPGTVIYAGWLGDYGQVVEIDHGFGIVTLYAHLRRCLAAVGQTVPAQAEIGLVGMTGRSTGPHVHYEVRVDGQPQDPEKFLSLARLLPAATPGPIPAAGGPAGNSR